MPTEVLFSDGSTAVFHDEGGSAHHGGLAMERIRLIMARSALSAYIKSNGKMQMTRNGATLAIRNVIEPLTGITYKRSMNGKRDALADCEALIAAIEHDAVILETGDVS